MTSRNMPTERIFVWVRLLRYKEQVLFCTCNTCVFPKADFSVFMAWSVHYNFVSLGFKPTCARGTTKTKDEAKQIPIILNHICLSYPKGPTLICQASRHLGLLFRGRYAHKLEHASRKQLVNNDCHAWKELSTSKGAKDPQVSFRHEISLQTIIDMHERRWVHLNTQQKTPKFKQTG